MSPWRDFTLGTGTWQNVAIARGYYFQPPAVTGPEQAWYPSGGFRIPGNGGQITDTDARGFDWSSTCGAANTAFPLRYNGTVYVETATTHNRTDGIPVRCIRE